MGIYLSETLLLKVEIPLKKGMIVPQESVVWALSRQTPCTLERLFFVLSDNFNICNLWYINKSS